MPDPTPEVTRVIEDFNRSFAQREVEQWLIMGRRWKQVEDNLELYIRRLVDKIEKDMQSGKIINPDYFMRLDYYQELMTQIAAETAKYEQYAENVIKTEQRVYLDYGMTAARSAVRTAGINAGFKILDIEATQAMVGLAGDGSPLFSILRKRALTPDAVEGLQRNLIEAIALGYNPNKTAIRMASGLSEGFHKALTIARTEQIRVYRYATLESYKRMEFIKGYVRRAAHDERNCIGCLALDGTIMQKNELIASHPNCRCYVTPMIDGKEYVDNNEGEAWLEKQSEEKQKTILGSHYDLWINKDIPLRDMVRVEKDKTWGPTIKIVPVKEFANE